MGDMKKYVIKMWDMVLKWLGTTGLGYVNKFYIWLPREVGDISDGVCLHFDKWLTWVSLLIFEILFNYIDLI